MGIIVVSPCYVLLALCEQDGKGVGQLPFKGFSKACFRRCSCALFFYL